MNHSLTKLVTALLLIWVVRIAQADDKPSFLGKSYKLESSKNFDKFMEALGNWKHAFKLHDTQFTWFLAISQLSRCWLAHPEDWGSLVTNCYFNEERKNWQVHIKNREHLQDHDYTF